MLALGDVADHRSDRLGRRDLEQRAPREVDRGEQDLVGDDGRLELGGISSASSRSVDSLGASRQLASTRPGRSPQASRSSATLRSTAATVRALDLSG